MIAKNNLIVFIFLIILNFILSKFQQSNLQAPINGTDFPGIKCGRDQPKKKKHCTEYGTDSGMLCCWISDSEDSQNGQCTLLSVHKAEEKEIDGDTLFIKDDKTPYKYWDCGNKSIYLNINIFLFFVFLFITIL